MMVRLRVKVMITKNFVKLQWVSYFIILIGKLCLSEINYFLAIQNRLKKTCKNHKKSRINSIRIAQIPQTKG